MKKFLLCIGAVALLAGCSDGHRYEFTPEKSEDGGDPHNIECGVVQYVTIDGVSGTKRRESVGRVCTEED